MWGTALSWAELHVSLPAASVCVPALGTPCLLCWEMGWEGKDSLSSSPCPCVPVLVSDPCY